MCEKCFTGEKKLPVGVKPLGIQYGRRYFTMEFAGLTFLNSASIALEDNNCGVLGTPVALPLGADIQLGDEVPLRELHWNLLNQQNH